MSPVASFSPSMPENRKFYTMSDSTSSPPPLPDADSLAFMQGVHDNLSIVELSVAQMGVLLTFAPPAASYVMDSYALSKSRKAMSASLKIMVDEGATTLRKDQASNLLTTLPYMFLQYEGNRSDRERCDFFDDKLSSGDFAAITVGQFKKRSTKVKAYLDRAYEFIARRHRDADKSAMVGEYGKR